MTLHELRQLLDNIKDPSNGSTLKENKAIKHLAYNDETDLITLIVAIQNNDKAYEKSLKREIAKTVKLVGGYKGLRLEIEEAKNKQTTSVNINKKIKYIGIISGKGGVGKSSVAANIAYRMVKRNFKVGLIDADIYGSSLPTILGFEHQRPMGDENQKILPIKAGNLELISTEFFTEPSQPVIWRGGMLNSMLNHFFSDVKWADDTDFIIVDYPPGTGDITLDVKNFVPECKMILVTTPHPSAAHVAVKAGVAARKLDHEIMGVVENMSYYINPVNNEKEFIFGEGGGEIVANELNAQMIAQIPINRPKNGSDLFEIEETNGKVYDDILDFILLNINN